jgi:predicted PurR-regulated permease PerM
MDKLPKQFSITITAGTVIKTVAILILVYALYYLRDVLLLILTAVVIASAIEPITSWFVDRKIPRILGVIIIYASVTATMVGLFYLVLPMLITDASNLIDTLPAYVEKVELYNPMKTEFLGGISVPSIKEVLGGLSNAASSATLNFVATLSGIFGGLVSFALIVVLSFYLSVQKDGVTNFLKIIVPDTHEVYVLDLWKRSQTKIGLWMQGQMVLSLLVSVLLFLVLALLGVRNALLLAILAGIFELIPVFGMILATIPALAISLADGGVSLMLIVLGAYILIQQFENHLFYPLVVKKIVGIPALFVIIALIIGAKLAGFLGILLAVPAAAVIMEILSDIEKNKAARQILK